MPGRPMTEKQKRKKRERERELQNIIPVLALASSKLLHKFLSWTLNRLCLRMSYFKWMHIFKKWFNCFSFVQK